MKNRHERGQMLLVVVLTMIIALTIGLSVASRSITNLRISRQSEESSRAFQAAEAGVEEILQTSPNCTEGATCSLQTLQNNTSYQTKVAYPSGTSFMLNGGELVDQAVGIDVWLSDYPNFSNPRSGTLTVYWATNNQTGCTSGGPDGPLGIRPAMEVLILSGSRLTPIVPKYLIETNNCTARIQNAGTAGPGGTPPGLGISFQNSFTTAPFINGLIARVIPIFNSSKIAMVSNISLPRQGTIIESTGKSRDTVRKVQYFASYPQIPYEIFPYSLISQ